MEHVDTELHEAVRYGDTNLVESALKDAGLDPNAIGLYQWSPMHEAASNGDMDILTLLIKFNGNPNAGDNLHGCTAIHYAAKEGHVDCLQLLLDHGGRYEITNNDGETPLDMAEGKCKEILERQRTGDFITQTLQRTRLYSETNKSDKPDYHDGELQKDRHPTHLIQLSPPPRTSTPTTWDQLSPPPRTSTPTAWDHIEVLESTNSTEAGTGLLQLSFEYNSRKSILKIRVWQVEDLLLPPVEFANINRIYVKSRLLPDKKGETKRRTEEHRLDDQDKMKNNLVTLKRKEARESFKAIFLPCTFKFSKALEYKKISKDIVASSTVHFDICVKQKFSTKSFSIANIQMPLRTAVRKLRKEYHQLHPCINYTMPDNIHVYDPKDLVIVTKGMYSNTVVSQPNLRALSERNLQEEKQRRTNSDINLKAVRTQSVESIPSVVLDVSEESFNTINILQEVKTDDLDGSSGRTIVQMNEVLLPGSTNDELEEIRVVKQSRSTPDVSQVDSSIETSFSQPTAYKSKVTRAVSPSLMQDLEDVKVVKPRYRTSRSSPNVAVVNIRDTRQSSPSSQDFQIKIESIANNKKQNVKPRLKGATVKHAADELQMVTVETPKRKSKDHITVIELDNLNMGMSRSELNQPISPQLCIPEIRIIDPDSTMNDGTIVGTVNTTHRSGQKRLYQKRRQTSEPARPGRAIDLRAQPEKECKAANMHVEEHRKKVDLSHEEELSIGDTSDVSNESVTEFEEVQEVKTKYIVESKVASQSEMKKDIVDTRNASQSERMKPFKSHAPVRQKKFPQPLTQGLMHTELNSLPQVSMKNNGQKTTHAKHSTSATHVHFESETAERSPKLKQEDPVMKTPSKRVTAFEEADIEQTELVLDPALMATPEFKLKAFQRTGKDPHPSTPFLRYSESKAGLNDTALERIDPFYVEGTPLQSPVSHLGSPIKIGSSANEKDLSSSSNSNVKSPGAVARHFSQVKLKSLNKVHQKSANSSRSYVRDRSPSPGVPTSGTDLLSEMPGVHKTPGDTVSNGKSNSRSRSPGNDSSRSEVSYEYGENNNTSQGCDKRDTNKVQNPAVSRLKQNWF